MLMTNKSDEEKLWDNLTKEYLTVAQKIAIIRKQNSDIAAAQWERAIASLRDYIDRNSK